MHQGLDAIITPKTFDRKELKFEIVFVNSKEKFNKLKGILLSKLPHKFNLTTSAFFDTRGENTMCGLVFCPHVSGEYGIQQVAQGLKTEAKIHCDIYSGSEPRGEEGKEYQEKKNRVAKDFKNNKLPLLVCTKAFGMGIDKPNIRYTIHYNLPPSIEAFYQEAGRAGRDRNTAYCYIIASVDDERRVYKLLDPNTKVEDIREIISNLNRTDNDDITRLLYFHVNSFKGISEEKEVIEQVLRELKKPKDLSERGYRKLLIKDEEDKMVEAVLEEGVSQDNHNAVKGNNKSINDKRNMVEKALFRLSVIGAVSDYTVDYSKNEIKVLVSGANKEEIIDAYGKYVENYLYSRGQTERQKLEEYLGLPYEDFIMKALDHLLNFIYDITEKGRRRAIQEMWQAIKDSPSDQEFRERIVKYLKATEYSKKLEDILEKQRISFSYVCDILHDIVVSNKEADQLRGEVSRYLESYPDNPSLLFIRSYSEVFSSKKDINIARENFKAGLNSAVDNYLASIDMDDLLNFISWYMDRIIDREKELVIYIAEDVLDMVYQKDIFKEKRISITEKLLDYSIKAGVMQAQSLFYSMLKKYEKYFGRLEKREFVKGLPEELALVSAWSLLEDLKEMCDKILV